MICIKDILYPSEKNIIKNISQKYYLLQIKKKRDIFYKVLY